MKLTTKQLDYIYNKLRTIKREKTTNIKLRILNTSCLNPTELPTQIQKALKIIEKFNKEEAERYKVRMKPIEDAYDQAESKLLFADNLEKVENIINQFKSTLEKL